MDLSVEDSVVIGRMVCGAGYQGPPGHVQGGIIAAGFDSVLGIAQALTGQSGMTAGLSVRYLRPAPLYTELRFEARVAAIDGRKITVTAQLVAKGVLRATAEGLFIIRKADV
jgi:acyl-coenzyme A thioesterase PaaI-like protein